MRKLFILLAFVATVFMVNNATAQDTCNCKTVKKFHQTVKKQTPATDQDVDQDVTVSVTVNNGDTAKTKVNATNEEKTVYVNGGNGGNNTGLILAIVVAITLGIVALALYSRRRNGSNTPPPAAVPTAIVNDFMDNNTVGLVTPNGGSFGQTITRPDGTKERIYFNLKGNSNQPIPQPDGTTVVTTTTTRATTPAQAAQ